MGDSNNRHPNTNRIGERYRRMEIISNNYSNEPDPEPYRKPNERRKHTVEKFNNCGIRSEKVERVRKRMKDESYSPDSDFKAALARLLQEL